MTDTTMKLRETIEDPVSEPHKGEARVRQCLRCQTAFHSEWAGERVCVKCKTSSTWRSGIPVRASGSSGKR